MAKLKQSVFSDPDYKPTTLVELLKWRAHTQPEKTAYIYVKDGNRKEVRLTYGELDQRARAVATSLQRKGLSGSRALLLYPPGLDYIIGFFGCLYADVIAVPAYPPDPNRLNRSLPRLQAIVSDARATVALTTDSIMYMIKILKLGQGFTSALERVPLLRKFRTTMKYFSTGSQAVAQSNALNNLQWISTDSIAASSSDEWSDPKITKDSIAFLQYTSGSTGTPKGVILTHDNLLSNSEIIFNAMQYGPNTLGVFWLPIYHDMGLIGGVLQPLYGGLQSLLMSPLEFLQHPISWLEIMSQHREQTITTAAPNFAYDLCVKKATPEKLKNLDLSHWEIALSGAEPVRHHTIERFTETFKSCGFRKEAFFPAYGLAEATLLVTGSSKKHLPVTITVDSDALKEGKLEEVRENHDKAQTLVSSGYNQPGQRTVIVDTRTSLECSSGTIGEIWVKGPSISSGYYKRPEESKETFANYLAGNGDGPYLRTGDLGFIKDGELFVAGRMKDLIIIRGRNYYPQDIEFTVEHAHEEIRHGCTAAFSIEEDDEEHLIIVAEVRHSKNAPFGDIIAAIRQDVTETFDIHATGIVLIKARTIAKTSSGKIQRHAVKNEFLDGTLKTVHQWHLKAGEPIITADREIKSALPEQAQAEALPEKLDDTAKMIEDWLVTHLAEVLGVDTREIDIHQPFSVYGLDSAQAIGMVGDLEVWLDRSISPTVIWDYPNIHALCSYLSEEGVAPTPVTRKRRGRSAEAEPIAIIGYALRLPGAENADAFWQGLLNEVDAITEVPPERWPVDKYFNAEPLPAKMITRWGGFLKDVDKFDPQFFGISPREAPHMDPQQRLLLEVSWEAIENAGLTLDSIQGSKTGVYIGISQNDYSRLQTGDFNRLDAYSGTGNAFCISANRISYTFDLKGPSFSMDTACSSSLVAVHNAVLSLRKGESDMALAGGVNLILSPEVTITFSQARMMAADGRCKTFDESADGYVRGEGVGMIVLKRLSEAIRDGDRIRAVIRGSSVNQDGKSNGITAPNGLAQQAVIREALEDARLIPTQVSYFEAHGTGTRLGDPIEVEALKNVMKENRTEENPLYIGSVKTNIGHLESAAGIAGVLKTIMSLEYEVIPKHLHFNQLNPLIKLENSHIRIVEQMREWKRGKNPRFAGISAYGFGGTNAHVILQEAPEVEKAASERLLPGELPALLFPFSAHNRETLRALAQKYREFLSDDRFTSNENILDLIYSSGVRRSHHDYRAAVSGRNRQELLEGLDAFIRDESGASVFSDLRQPDMASRLVFVFSGQGPQWFAMGRELFDSEPVYREWIEKCDRLLGDYTDWSLVQELQADEDVSRIADTEVAQPAIFALQVGLARLWQSWGVKPAAVVGHSVGEVAAAYISGVLSLEDAIKVIYHRSRLMQRATGYGKMASVELSMEEAQKYVEGLEDKISIAAHNSPTTTVLSGDPEVLEEILRKLEEKEVYTKMLRVNYAFHSPHMEPFKDELARELQSITLNQPGIPVYPTVTGRKWSDGDYAPAYWSRNIRERVRFADTIATMLKDGYHSFVEIAPHPVLGGAVNQISAAAKKAVTVVTSLRRKEEERRQMISALALLYAKGLNFDWRAILPAEGRFIPLPPYPWQRQPYWFDLKGRGPEHAPLYRRGTGIPDEEAHPLLGKSKSSPVSPGKRVWTPLISLERLEYLADHKVQESIVFPATGYLEMALAAAYESMQNGTISIQNMSFFRALFLSEERDQTAECILSPNTNGDATFQIFSPEETDRGNLPSKWSLNSMGLIHGRKEAIKPDNLTVSDIKSRCKKSDISGFFTSLEHLGLHYGSSFRGVDQLFVGSQEAIAHVTLADLIKAQRNQYRVHPALLDSCFQVLSAAIGREVLESQKESTFMPVSVAELTVYERPETEAWSYARVTTFDEERDNILGDIIITQPDGSVAIEVRGLKLKRLGQKKTSSITDWLYRVEWQNAERTSQPSPSEKKAGRWLVFRSQADRSVQNLEDALANAGSEIIRVEPGLKFERISDQHLRINPVNEEDYNRLFEAVSANGSPGLLGVIHSWTLDTADTHNLNPDEIRNIEDKSLTGATFLGKTMVRSGLSVKTPLFILTRGAFRIGEEPACINIAQTPVWGIGRVLSNEHVDFTCIKIDLAPDAGDTEETLLLQEILNPDREREIALREGQRFAARLVRDREILDDGHEPDASAPAKLNVPSQPFLLESASPGMLSALRYVPAERPAPAAGQVEIQVVASGLNFRDVLMALGLYPGDPIPLGSECSGIVSRIGEGVTNYREGDEVMGMAPNTFGKYALTLSDLLVHKPDNVSFTEAATVPITYLTAYFALHHLGRLQKGERVLIHAGAGGVGQAAIQIAQMTGAEIFATAGSPEKRAFLEKLGVTHVLNSRSLDFADEIMQRTSQEGVDVVLNSLAGEYIPRSLALLKAYGRFLEIGKTDIYQNSQLDLFPFRNNLSYYAIDLDMVSRDKPDLINNLFTEIMTLLRDGKLKPLPFKEFPATGVIDAFRFMAQRKNIGKVVISMDTSESAVSVDTENTLVKQDAAYLITGGLGALGLLVAEWLAEKGAGHIILMSRSKPSDEISESLKTLQKTGSKITLAIGDVTDTAQLSNVLNDIAKKKIKIRGILHCAGVLDDHAFLLMTRESLHKVMLPKIHGSWNLHYLTADYPLDFFVLFSSVAAVVGNPGQSNYAAANLFMDALADYRKSRGLKALSVNWGYWEETGMTADNAGGTRGLSIKGTGKIPAADGLQILDRLLARNAARSVVAPVDWPSLLAPYPDEMIPPIYLNFKHLKKQTDGTSPGEGDISREELSSLSEEERLNTVAVYLQNHLAKVLGISSSQVERDKALNTMGLDSLMAIELKNSVETGLAVNLPIATLLKGPSIDALAVDMLSQLMEADEEVVSEIVVEEDDSEYPVSQGQKAMWFQHQLAPTSIYNQVYAVRIPAKIDRDALRSAVNALVDRHESLRTNFVTKEGRPLQVVTDQGRMVLKEVDVSGLSDEQIDGLLHEEIERPFDLENEPLTRLYMFSRKEDEHIFLYTAHHIISDMWSLAIFMYELNQFYTDGADADLPDTGYTYSGYVRDQIKMLNSSTGKYHLDYWKEKLSGELPALDLKTDKPRPAIQTYNGLTEMISINRELADKIEHLAEETNTTIYATLLAVFNLLMYRYTGQTDILVGSPTTGRTRPEYAGVLGYFVNPVAIRTAIDPSESFSKLLSQVRDTVVDALEHQDYPFNLLVEALHPKRDPSRTPIFQHMFVYQKAYMLHESGMSGLAVAEEGGKMMLGDIPLESIAIEDRVVPFDITFLTAELDDGLGASLQYNTDLFQRETAVRMLAHFHRLLEVVIENPDQPLSSYMFLSDTEIDRLVRTWNNSGVPYSEYTPVPQMFAARAAHAPDAPALVFNNSTLSYDQLNRKANQLAHRLIAGGIGPDTIVGISAERSPEMIIGILGILKAGAAYLPIDPAYPQDRLAFMLNDSQVPLLITQKKMEAHLPENNFPRLYLDDLDTIYAEESERNPDLTPHMQNLAYVIYTSGSTGRPKGVMLNHFGFRNLVMAQIKGFGITPESRLLQFASFSFDAAASEIFTTLVAGATLVLIDQQTLMSGPDLIQFIISHNISISTLPPSVLRVLPSEQLGNLKTVISAGESCTTDIAERWTDGHSLINAYGPTEGTICATMQPVETMPENGVVPIGKPIDNVKVYVLDANLNLVPHGIPGELYIAGHGVARGYLNRPDLTAEQFMPDPFSGDEGARMYKSGDLVRWLPDGTLEFLERIDNQIKIRGFRIELGEIEAELKLHDSVKDALVLADGRTDKRLIAYIIPEPEIPFRSDELKYNLRKQLPDYMIPSHYIEMESFPLTANGKIDFKALPKPETDKAQFVKAETETERKLAEIWQDVLDLEQVGTSDNFFDLGGHSLNIIQTQSKIKEVFDRQVDVVDMFRYPTIATFAKFLADDQSGKDMREKTEIRAARQKQALDAQRQRMRNRRKK